MNKRILLVFLIVSLFAIISCSPPPPVIRTYNVDVPFHAQGDGTLCQPASLWMIADWVAGNYGGYFNTDFLVDYYYSQIENDIATEQNILNFLNSYPFGTRWDYMSPQSVSNSYSMFLYYKTNITTSSGAYLNVHYSSSSAIQFLMNEISASSRPLIVFFYNGSNSGHVVVACGYDEKAGVIQSIRYNDPWFGSGMSASESQWNSYTGINSDYWMTMSFPI